ncbi:MAG TPA: C4-dicarboxylate ABC transporter, partial [Beijerinckiaceae bacterium]|nr:C4-dicarboxylate ABC transporter [Beijerinckiaceae bacterium]
MFAYGVMPPLMFGAMILFLLIGFPVAFSLAAVGLFFGLLGIATQHFDPNFLQALPFRFFGIVSNELL